MVYQDDRARYRQQQYEEWQRYGQERGFINRITDEVRSWFGDTDAERRRQMDQQMSRIGDYEQGEPGYERTSGDRPEWQRKDYSGASPRGSQPEPRGRYDEPSMPNRMSREQAMRYQGEYNRQISGEPGRAGQLRDRVYQDVSTMEYGYPEGSTRPRFFEEGRDYQQGREWGRFNDRDTQRGLTFGPHHGRGPRNYQRSDERISDDIHKFLTYNPEIDATDIEVNVESGVVILRGAVECRYSKRLAEDIAEDVYGVKEVHNELRVNRGDFTNMGQKVSDDQMNRNRMGSR